MNQLHQIALNNYNDVAYLIANKYQLPIPENTAEFVSAIDVGTDMFGDSFVSDVYNIEMQRKAFTQQETAYKQKLDTSSLDQLKQELNTLNDKLANENDISMREYVLDKIAYVQKLIIEKKDIKSEPNSIHLNNQKLLLILTGIALMVIGSKILK